MSYVEFKDVKKVYKTGEVEINALRDVDFEIEKGEFCVYQEEGLCIEAFQVYGGRSA